MSLQETLPETKVRYCKKCGEKLSPSISVKDSVCRNTQACNARAGRQQRMAPKPEPAVYGFIEGSVAWHITRAVAQRYGTEAAGLRKLCATHERTRSRYITCFLLRQDAKLTYPDIAKALGMNLPTNARNACDRVKDYMHQYQDEINKVREKYHEALLASSEETPPSTLVVVA